MVIIMRITAVKKRMRRLRRHRKKMDQYLMLLKEIIMVSRFKL